SYPDDDTSLFLQNFIYHAYYNHLMRKLLLLCSLLLTACQPTPAPGSPTHTTDDPLQPYLTGTPIATNTPNVLIIVETPQPTSTMQVYVIESGDTTSEIAEKFNISQSDLLAA